MKREDELGAIRFVAQSDITAARAKVLNEYFPEELESASSGDVVLDLTAIDFVDSSGIGAIVGLSRICEEKGLGFRIEVLSADILRVLRTCNLHNMFEIRDVSPGEEQG